MPDTEMIKISELTEATEYLANDYTIIDNGTTSRKIKVEKIGGSVDMAEIVDAIYPIGSIYMSASSTANPATLFPGTTWEALQDRFLLGAGNNYALGAMDGEATHTLTVDEMPAHNHSISRVIGDTGRNSSGWIAAYVDGSTTTGNRGGDQAHNNMPPYLAVYMWKRTA